MIPAIELLKKRQITFNVLSYEHDGNNSNYGQEAVEKLNLNSAQVFKTLVLETSEGQLVVAITPVTQQVQLKQLAKVCGTKKVTMAEASKYKLLLGIF